jgi:hypothetical protein
MYLANFVEELLDVSDSGALPKALEGRAHKRGKSAKKTL